MILNRFLPRTGQSGESGQSGGVDLTTLFPESTLANAVYFTGSGGFVPSGPELSESDKLVLRELGWQIDSIASKIRFIIDGEKNAFLIWGPGGHGKSYAVRKALDSVWDKVRLTRGDISAKGMFNLLKQFPTHIHVFEDMEKVYKDDGCGRLLRCACDGHDRTVHWEKDGHHREEPFQFEGGIIIISNDDPTGGSLIMRAIASRFAPQKWELTEDQMAAMMRNIAITGDFKELSPEERLEVAEFVIGEMRNRQLGVDITLRTFCDHALPAFHQFKSKKSLVHWHEGVRADIKGSTKRSSAEIEKDRSMFYACKADLAGPTKAQKVAAWKELTGLGPSQFYEYLKAAKEAGIYAKYQSNEYWAGRTGRTE